MMTLLGSMLLKAPGISMPSQAPLAWIDAILLSLSAVTGCGLSPIDAARQFSTTGFQALGLLMELGLLATGLATTLWMMRRAYGSSLPFGQIAKRYLLGTFFLQLLATTIIVALTAPQRFPVPVDQRIGWTLFHVISCLGNSGLTMQSDSLIGLRHDLLVHAMLLPLMIVGNLGMALVWDIGGALRLRRPLHPVTRKLLTAWALIYLATTLLLLGTSLLPYAYRAAEMDVEMNRPLEKLTCRQLGGHLADASFLAISARSTGMSVQPMTDIRPTGQIVLMTNMPMSLAGHGGGSLGLLLLGGLLLAISRAQKDESQFLRVAVARLLVSLMLLVPAMLLITAVEPYPIQAVLFECLSSLTGSGLSQGITPELGVTGKLMLMLLMLAGVLWPVALLVRMPIPRPRPTAVDETPQMANNP